MTELTNQIIKYEFYKYKKKSTTLLGNDTF